MRKGWVEYSLDDVTECSWGNTETTKSKYVDSGYLAYSASGADGFLEWFEHDRTAVVLSAIGAQCGKTWFAEGKWTSIKNTIWLKSDNSNLLDKYLYYLSNRDQFWQIRGQAQPFISLGDVKKTKVTLPPLPEQKRIVDLISSVDSYIEALQGQLQSVKRSRNAVLNQLLSAGGEEWVETNLGEVAEWWSGGTPKAREPKYYENGTIPWAVIADMNKGVIDSTNSCITEEALDLIGGRLAPVGSVLISMYASVGKSAIANVPLATNQAIAWSIPNQEKIMPFFLYLVSQQLEKTISDLARGATQRNINRQMLREFTFLLPPLPEQKRIVDLVSSIDDVIEQNCLAITEAKNLRSGLLSDLLSGEHEIPASYDKVMGAA
jgi:type I restriction enzyme S subunit